MLGGTSNEKIMDNKILDIGCGPSRVENSCGHDIFQYAELDQILGLNNVLQGFVCGYFLNYLCESYNRTCSIYSGIHEWITSYCNKIINGSFSVAALFIHLFIFRSDQPLASFKRMVCDHDRFVFAGTSLVFHSPENKNKFWQKRIFLYS